VIQSEEVHKHQIVGDNRQEKIEDMLDPEDYIQALAGIVGMLVAVDRIGDFDKQDKEVSWIG